ncbi:DUF167 domain-containing protein [Candidatus Proelusimicrobium volucris]|uniref:DUF167 domain-containing protein n=1 Tax=Candidatus Proelusimicrobium volucris TaxID=3416225 RepID=UPI003D0BE6B5
MVRAKQKAIAAKVNNVYIKVKVHAGEKKNDLKQKSQDAFEIWVKAPAERGLANDAVRTILASHLGLEAKKLHLIKGATSPAKIFEIK